MWLSDSSHSLRWVCQESNQSTLVGFGIDAHKSIARLKRWRFRPIESRDDLAFGIHGQAIIEHSSNIPLTEVADDGTLATERIDQKEEASFKGVEKKSGDENLPCPPYCNTPEIFPAFLASDFPDRSRLYVGLSWG